MRKTLQKNINNSTDKLAKANQIMGKLKQKIDDLNVEISDLKDDLNQKRGLLYNPILPLLDRCFNNLYDVSDLCWEYVNSMKYCDEHKHMYYTERCVNCDYNDAVTKRKGQYYLNDALNIYFYSSIFTSMEIIAINEIDRITFGQFNYSTNFPRLSVEFDDSIRHLIRANYYGYGMDNNRRVEFKKGLKIVYEFLDRKTLKINLVYEEVK